LSYQISEKLIIATERGSNSGRQLLGFRQCQKLHCTFVQFTLPSPRIILISNSDRRRVQYGTDNATMAAWGFSTTRGDPLAEESLLLYVTAHVLLDIH